MQKASHAKAHRRFSLPSFLALNATLCQNKDVFAVAHPHPHITHHTQHCRILSLQGTKHKKLRHKTMHSHPRVLLLLAAATLSTACSPPICAPGCNITYSTYVVNTSFTGKCEPGMTKVHMPVDSCTPRVLSVKSLSVDVCGSPSIISGYEATLECLSEGECTYTADLARSSQYCGCDCSVEAKCAAQQSKQVSECPQDAACSEVEVCGVKGLCQPVTKRGEGTCATRPCSGSHTCTQDTSSIYTCNPLPISCCEAAAICASGEQSSNTPCTADEVSSGTCSRNAICCSEVFCRTASCSIEEKCAAQQSKQVSECPQDAACSEVEVCGVKGLCQPVTVQGEGTCATRPCSGSHTCTQDTSTQYTCNALPIACCLAMPICASGEQSSNTPCTADELSSGTCSRNAMCCSEVFCRTASCSIEAKCAAQQSKQVSDKCPQDAACSEVEVCGVKGLCQPVTVQGEGTCDTGPCSDLHLCRTVSASTYSCVPRPFACCLAAPLCASGEDTSNTPCTADEVSSGTCSRNAICCSEVFCRKGGSDDDVPTYAWVLIAIAAALLVVAVIAAVVMCTRKAPAQETDVNVNKEIIMQKSAPNALV